MQSGVYHSRWLMQSGLEYRIPAYIIPIQCRPHCAASQCSVLILVTVSNCGYVAVPVGLPDEPDEHDRKRRQSQM